MKYCVDSSKEQNIDIIDYNMKDDNVKFSNKEAEENFIGTALEIVFDIEIDLDTGECKVTHIDGVEISEDLFI